MLRVDGEIKRVKLEAIQEHQLKQILQEIATPEQYQIFEQQLEVDFAFEIPHLSCFRANAFQQNKGVSLVLHTVSQNILTLDQINAPTIIKHAITAETGLILVTGSTGSGKLQP